MAEEIERKFRVAGDGWRSGEPLEYRQGYLNTD
jgi:CYTH domain-containing protein